MALHPDSYRAKQAAKTRAAILAVAGPMFRNYGYEHVTVRQIAKAAGCSTGAVFTHWTDGKDALFTEAMGRAPVTDAVGARALAALRELGVTL